MDCIKGRTGYEQLQGNNSQILDNTDPASTENENENILTIFGFQQTIFRSFLYHLISILLAGLPYILLILFPTLKFYRHKKSSLDTCDLILVTSNQGQSQSSFIYIKLIDKINKKTTTIATTSTTVDDTNINIRLFSYQHVHYIWNNNLEKFIKLENPDINKSISYILENNNGIDDDEREYLLELYGLNIISVPVKSYYQLFKSEILNPFYLFQIFSIILWSIDNYYYYAGCIMFLSSISIISSLYETKRQSITLRDLVENAIPTVVQIKQKNDQQIIDITPEKLTPGDIIVLPQIGCTMPCDCILITGTCIVNESMLTGESVPIMKTPPNNNDDILSFDGHKRHILFSGTNVVQTRYYGNEKVLAKVIRTGFSTSKGELIKSILYPQPIGFQFYKDSIKFVTALFCIAILGMIYCVRIYMIREEKISTIVIRTLDIITIVVPPALPMAITAGTIYSQSRLKKLGIFCISPPRINICGKIKLACFDKTGTLTDDNLTMLGVIESKQKTFDVLIKNLTTLNVYTEFVQGLATCHSLTTINGQITGDPLDIEIFKSVDWKLIEPGMEHTRFDSLAPIIVRPNVEENNLYTNDTEVPYLIGIIKCHQFSSEKQCMSVITRVLGHKHMKVFTKGAPEKIKNLCHPETIPANFNQLLRKYTSLGYRVIAIGYRELSTKIKWRDAEKMRREEIEKNLQFLGLLILQNNLKPETKPIIEDLHAANIRTLMITGDNLMTAISVARDCRMVLPDEEILIIKHSTDYKNELGAPKLCVELDNKNLNGNERFKSSTSTIVNINVCKYRSAMDGPTWSIITEHYKELLPNLLARGTIFARFAPEQKSQLIMYLQQLDYIVVMCGDGANDCSALRVAHVGISLSQAEASVAAPFTSNIPNITCVKLLALEGRCALITSFHLFKYMTLYSLIQFCTILILYSKCSILGNIQFLYIDLGITASLAFLFGKTKPSSVLVSKRPNSSLVSLANVIPLLLQVFLCATIQILSLLFLVKQKWFVPLVNCSTVVCWENTVVFTVSAFQYLILGAVYCKGKPYRQTIFKNYLFMTVLLFLTGFTVMLLIHPYKIFADFFEIISYSSVNEEKNKFRLLLLALPIVHFFGSLSIENLIAEKLWFKKFIHFLIRKKKPKNRYKIIENELEENTDWLNNFETRNNEFNVKFS